MPLGRGLESLIPPQSDLPVPARQTGLPVPTQQTGSGQAPSDDAGQSFQSDLAELEGTAELASLPAAVALPTTEETGRETGALESAAPPRIISNKNVPRPRRADERRYDSGAVFQIEVEKIQPNPDQPRRRFDEAALRELALSIREFGVLQPLIVSKIEKETEDGSDVEYQLIAGERRLMASKLAGLPRVPAIIRQVGARREQLELAIIENLQREDLTPIETARAFARLQDEFALTQREIAARLGKSRESVANTIRLLNLPTHIQKSLEEGRINESQGRLLLGIADLKSQEKAFNELIKESLSVRELKTRIQRLVPPKATEPEDWMHDEEATHVKEQLEQFFGAPVKVERMGEAGKIVITYYSPEELKNIISRLELGKSEAENMTRNDDDAEGDDPDDLDEFIV